VADYTGWAGRLAGFGSNAVSTASAAASSAVSAAGRALRPDSFGAEPTGERLERVRRSPNFVAGSFRNPVAAQLARPSSIGPLLRVFLRAEDRAKRTPAGAIPVHRLTPDDLAAPPASGLRVTWLGHAGMLVEIDGRRVLFDPVWGDRCSPFPFAGPKRLHPAPLPLADVGPVDVIVVSHDHYDHLDMPTIKALVGSGAPFAVPLGLGAHLEHWGVPQSRIIELDWNESAVAAGLRLTATPARHFCGRGLRNNGPTLWSSWVVAGPEHRVFHSGDTGYFPGFADIGATHGPFDATMMAVGAYSEFWPDIHMNPEEAVRAHRDVSGGQPHGIMLPMHWATFRLAPHPWAEPVERAVAAARADGARLVVPRPGQPVEPATGAALDTGSDTGLDMWWRVLAVPAGESEPAQSGTATPAPEGAPA
jgi:L-ascorbate metabolism protein UlaG (beta-lactamase superfamily)